MLSVETNECTSDKCSVYTKIIRSCGSLIVGYLIGNWATRARIRVIHYSLYRLCDDLEFVPNSVSTRKTISKIQSFHLVKTLKKYNVNIFILFCRTYLPALPFNDIAVCPRRGHISLRILLSLWMGQSPRPNYLHWSFFKGW